MGKSRKAKTEPTVEGHDGFGVRARVVVAGLVAIGLVAGCGGWAAQAKLSGAVIAHGVVAVEEQVKRVQHRDGGIVAEILVQNGDAVKAGDVLVRLDETQIKAELGVIRAQLAEFRGRGARLAAERSGSDAIDFEPDFETEPETAAIAAGEVRLFSENLAMREAQREQLGLQIEQFEEQIRGMESQKNASEIEGSMVADDLERLRPLVKQNIVEVARVRTMERDLAKVEGLKGEVEADIARVRGQISEARMKIIELDRQVRTDAQRELRDMDGRIAELQERRVAAEDRLSRMDLRAPISGYVNESTIHTVNGVIAPGETVMSIVPEGANLVVEARLSPVDIDQVAVGQPAKLRFSAFNQRTTPEIDGRLEIVAAAATVDAASGESYYLSKIAIEDGANVFADKTLVPGMPVEVFVTTGERSALSYLVKPFSDQMMRSFRED